MKRAKVVTCGYINIEVLDEKDNEVEVEIVREEPKRKHKTKHKTNRR